MLRVMGQKVIAVSVRLLVASFPEDAPRGAVTRFCAEHGISRSWFYEMRARARAAEGYEELFPRSRAPKNRPQQISPQVADLACELRSKLQREGWDCGPLSVQVQMRGHNLPVPSRATLARLFAARGLVEPAPNKRPRSSYRSYASPLPNMLWCADGFDYQLASGTTVCVLQLLDDCSRMDLGSRAASGETSREIKAMLQAAIDSHGQPHRFLSDNGAGFNPSRRGRVGQVESWLRSLGVQPITCRPAHPRGNGKAERGHQTLQRWLAARDPASSLEQLQDLIEQFRDGYNHRPHQGLGMATPQQVWDTRPHAEALHPGQIPQRMIDKRIKVAANGNVATGHWGTVNIGNRHAGEYVIVVVDQATISVLDELGTFLRTVRIEPGRTYYGLKPRH